MNENIKCEMVGMLNDEISKHQFECTRRVYGTDGLCPTLVVCGGGWTEHEDYRTGRCKDGANGRR